MSSSFTCTRCSGGQIPTQFPAARVCTVCGVDVWAAGESPFSANSYCGADPDGSIRITPGDPRFIFTAASSVNYYRGPARMPAARFTGSLAEVAAHLTGGMAITASSQPASVVYETENLSIEQSFAKALQQSVAKDSFIIDLRGMRERSFAVCIGTGPLPDDLTHVVADAVAETCSRRGLAAAVNEPFAALPPWTISHYAQMELGVNAVQIQLSASLRNPGQNKELASVALAAVRAAALSTVLVS